MLIELPKYRAALRGGVSMGAMLIGGAVHWRAAPVEASIFPAIDGTFYHFRQEDVTESGVSTADGLPMTLDLAGVLKRTQVGGVDYMDCAVGAVHGALATPFPADAPVTIWMLTSGERQPGIAFYLGGPIFNPGSNNLNFRATGGVIVQRTTSGSSVATWTPPAQSGPETIAYHRPAGASVSTQNFQFRVNGQDTGAAAGSFTATSASGAVVAIGGRRDPSGAMVFGNLAGLGVLWRDVVIYVGTADKPDLSQSEIEALEAYAALRTPDVPVSPLPPAVTNALDQGGYRGTTATITASGEITIANAATAMSGDLGVTHYLVRADNMVGRQLVVSRSTGAPNNKGTAMGQWQMAWAVDPHGDDWRAFSSVAIEGSMVVARTATVLTQDTVYIARRPVFTPQRWDAAIARWIASPLTSPTASGGTDCIVGLLPANDLAPQMPLYGFRFGTGPTPFVVTINIHSDEHIAGFSAEAMIDWLLSGNADAAWLRDRLTIYVYPRVNPQAHQIGAQRVEITTGLNANRIIGDAFDAIPLSKLLRDAWAADLPTKIGGHFDFHDAIQGNGQAFLYHIASLPFTALVNQVHSARTGRQVGVEEATYADMIATYIQARYSPDFSVTPEYETSTAANIPEWKAWGLDLGAALRLHYGALP